jgi:hypothetical protein
MKTIPIIRQQIFSIVTTHMYNMGPQDLLPVAIVGLGEEAVVLLQGRLSTAPQLVRKPGLVNWYPGTGWQAVSSVCSSSVACCERVLMTQLGIGRRCQGYIISASEQLPCWVGLDLFYT